MHPLSSSLRVALPFAALLTACGATVSGTHDASVTDVITTDVIATDVITTDATATCTLPNGTTCAVGAPCYFGCGTCTCPPGGGTAQCTALACADVPRDTSTGVFCRSASECAAGETCAFSESSCGALGRCEPAVPCAEGQAYCACDGATTYFACRPDRPTRYSGGCEGADAGRPDVTIDIPTAASCATSADCLGGRVCYFAVGACGARGTCGYARDCALITPYCGCDGATFMDCPGSETTTPASRAGACTTVDAGTPDAALCAGASIGPDRRSCLGPADGALPLWCCTGWDCDQSHAACESLPPRCAEGEVPTVAGACWGPCVPAPNCARRP